MHQQLPALPAYVLTKPVTAALMDQMVQAMGCVSQKGKHELSNKLQLETTQRIRPKGKD